MRVLSLVLVLGGVVLASGAEAAQRSCRSGDTVYKRGGVRVFSVYARGDDSYYACSRRVRRPVLLDVLSQAYGGFGIFGRSGDKLLFETDTAGEGGGSYATVGWFDVRTGQTRSGELVGEVSNDVLDMVVARDGSVGVAVTVDAHEQDESGVRVGYLARGSKRRALRGEVALAIASGRYAKRSLAFAGRGRALTWRSGGQAYSVPVTGEPFTCTAGRTLLESDGARVFEVLQGRKDVLAACSAGQAAPQRLAASETEDQDPWRLENVRRSGARVVFTVGDNGVGVIDGGRVTFSRPRDIESIQDIAVGATGPVVFAGATRGAGQSLIAALTGSGWVALATQGGVIRSGTLAVGDDGRVRWRMSDGLEQSTPLAGETVVDCTTGTTLHEKEGLRVFELLLAGADDARLLACLSGAAAPAQLAAGPRTASWNVSELARENGRIGLYADADSRGATERIFSLGADEVRVGAPVSIGGVLKDVALAADGRIAIALRSGKTWRVIGYALGGPGALAAPRTIAKPADGVKPGTLAFDGARVVWRSRAGAERTAAL